MSCPPWQGIFQHAPGQMEVLKTQVDDKSIKVGEQAAEDRKRYQICEPQEKSPCC